MYFEFKDSNEQWIFSLYHRRKIVYIYAISSIESMAFSFWCVFYTGYCGGPPEASGRYQRKGKNCQTPLNVNVSDCAGRTSLHHAAYNGHLEVKISYFDD